MVPGSTTTTLDTCHLDISRKETLTLSPWTGHHKACWSVSRERTLVTSINTYFIPRYFSSADSGPLYIWRTGRNWPRRRSLPSSQLSLVSWRDCLTSQRRLWRSMMTTSPQCLEEWRQPEYRKHFTSWPLSKVSMVSRVIARYPSDQSGITFNVINV